MYNEYPLHPVHPHSTHVRVVTAKKFYAIHTHMYLVTIIIGQSDVIIINESMIVIPAQYYSEVCITLEAVDDQIAEETESFNISVMAMNSLDSVVGETTVYVTDNDGQ